MPEESSELADALDHARTSAHAFQVLSAELRQQIAEVHSFRDTATDLVKSLQAELAAAQEAATAAVAARTQINDEQTLVAAKSAHIQGVQEHADKVRADLDRMLTSVVQFATEADGYRSRVQTANDTSSALTLEITDRKVAVDGEAAGISALYETAKTAFADTKKLADRSGIIDKRLAEYEAALSDLRKQAEEQLNTITGLLPGATAAGLAHAFDKRRETFLEPAKMWQWVFVGSVVSLVLLAGAGLLNVFAGGTLLGWDDLARLWMARLPIAGALVWLALHASREAALAKRLEEDYGYKAAIAASFLGFQQQMAGIGHSATEGSPLTQLCRDTLETIGSSPGRIYDRHRLTITPAGELAEATVSAVKISGIGKPT